MPKPSATPRKRSARKPKPKVMYSPSEQLTTSRQPTVKGNKGKSKAEPPAKKAREPESSEANTTSGSEAEAPAPKRRRTTRKKPDRVEEDLYRPRVHRRRSPRKTSKVNYYGSSIEASSNEGEEVESASASAGSSRESRSPSPGSPRGPTPPPQDLLDLEAAAKAVVSLSIELS